ncbi:LCP family protein [Curtobacterium sp. MCBD17_003]|uniref:LCP family protein n=1 Tax=Curtobacterium sp. MCBD17_003 TaxID=2175667 RepID=UPI000DA84477|nr:LCP family protein [Curtobacterium sp. MCBD17_003]WIE55579.1 LCP family protein [Curtobacterium sp. MCBD17_003]
MARERAAANGGIARHGRLRRSSRVGAVLRILAAVVAVAVVSSGSVAAIATWQVLQGAKPAVTLALPGVRHEAVPTLTAQSGEVNMLLVATDTRTGQGAGFTGAANQAASSGVGHNDTTILVHISQDHTHMAVVSFPRDLMVPIPACTNDDGSVTPASSRAMLNTALSRGGERHGLACVAGTISQLTGVPISYAGMVTFDGVVRMADAVGGVQVCLATPIHDHNVSPAIDLPAGTRSLSGAQAAAFLRSRDGVGDGSDLARISNQQTFMSALARQVVSAGTLTNPAKVLRLADTAFRSMTLSDTLTDPRTLARLALAVTTVGLSNMVFVQYPVVDDPEDPNRVDVATDPAGILNAALRHDDPIALSAGSLGRSAVVDPNPPKAAAPTAPPSHAAGGPSKPATAPSSGASTPSAPATTAQLPGSVSGQSAATVTCAAGRD